MKNIFNCLAKSNPEETIAEHTNKLLFEFDKFCNEYGYFFTDDEIKTIQLAIQYHDYGKMIDEFQNALKNGKKVKIFPHGYISPAFIDINSLDLNKEFVWVLINAIFYHHVRDKASFDEVESQITSLQLQVKEKLSKKYFFKVFNSSSGMTNDKWEKFALIKGMLNKFDYVASGNLEAEINGIYKDKKLNDIVESKFEKLRDVQSFMKDNSNENLIVTASTGIGKTEASLLWANGEKTFYTLPLKVSIEAIYNRIVDKYEYPKEKVALLHSDAIRFLMKEDEENFYQKYNQARNFSFPITVCTIDQLFVFVYKFLGCEIIPATLKYSRLIIDEIQAYSPEIVAKIICGLKIITEMGGKFAIVTATFSPVLQHFFKEIGIKYKKSETFFSPYKKRHFIKIIKNDFDYERIIEEGKTKKILVLCNTVSKAQEVYKKLKDNVNTKLLHSKFIKRNRLKLEEEILKFSKSNENGVWVSTQIVEASLDIDFDMLFTEMCPADNLLQRLGRCYRSRNYEENIPNVYVFYTNNESIYNRELGDEICKLSENELEKYDNKIFSEEDKIKYIDSVYSFEVLKDTRYFSKIEEEIRNIKLISPDIFTKEQAKRKFRDINNKVVIPEQIYSDVLPEKLKSIDFGNLDLKERIEFRNELLDYTMSVYDDRDISGLVCKDPEIYRIEKKYDFNEEELSGEGLTNEKYENNIL